MARLVVQTAVFTMDGPAPCGTVAYANGQEIRYVTYTMPEHINRALGMGCTGRTLSVPTTWRPPVVVCTRDSDAEKWVAVWMGSADALEAARIADMFAREGR